MKKIALFLCALLMTADVFAESLFDYIPKTSTYLRGTYGFTVHIHYWKTSADYSITNSNAEVGILAMSGHKDRIEFYVRLRSKTTNGDVKFYFIQIDSSSQIQISQLNSVPSFQDCYLFEGLTNDDLINFRDYPAVSGIKMGQYQKNNLVPFTGCLSERSAIDNAEDYWYSFNYNGKTAWMYGKYITFPSEISITTDMFSTSQVSETPAVTTQNATTTISDETPVSELDFVTCRFNSAGTSSTKTYDTGVSTVTFTNGLKGGSFTTTMTISKDGAVISSIFCEGGTRLYIPETAQFFYSQYYSGNQYILNGINCKDGSTIALPTSDTHTDFYIHTGDIQRNKTGDKLLCRPYPHDYNSLSYPFLIIDLKTMTTTEYTLQDRWADISFFHWITDTSFLLGESVTWDDITGNVKYTFSYITIEDGTAIIKRTFSPPEQYTKNCCVIAQDNDNIVVVRIDDEIWTLDSTGTTFQKKLAVHGSFISAFTYCGNQYYATVENEKELEFDAVIYDNAMNEIRRQTLTKNYYPDKIQSINVRNGSIQISLEVVK